MEATFNIQRYHPERDVAPTMQEFKLDVPEGATVLDCLNLIKWTQDGSLTFRMSCRSAICGSCSMKVNGHAMLVCSKQLTDVVKDGKVTIQPMGNMEILKDLAVDLTPFFKSLESVDPWLKPDIYKPVDRERRQSQKDFKKIDGASTCILCASCYSDCNVLEIDKKFLGPATYVKVQRFIYDTRDEALEQRVDQMNELHGVWDCTHCAECSTRCPTDADPLHRITQIKTAIMEQGLTSNSGARHTLGFRESVNWWGNLNENYLPGRSMGFFNIRGLLSIMPVGIRMFLRRKNPPLLHHAIERVSEIKKLFRRFEELRK